MSLRVFTTAAVVLHRINLGEHDKILTLYTQERGKLSAVAKGARKPLSKLAGATDLFTHSRMQLAVGRSLDVVTQTEILEPFRRIRTDLARIAYASVMAELIDRFVEERDPHPDLFTLLVDSLRALERDIHPELTTQLFELHLLANLGYRPHTESCVVGGEDLGSGPVAFSPALGGAVCAAHRRQVADTIPVRPDTIALTGALQRIAPGDAKSLDLLGPHTSAEMRRDLDKLLHAHVQYRLERPVKSLDFVREVQAMYSVDQHPDR